MRFRDKRVKKMSETHKDLTFNPKISRRQNRRMRKKGEMTHETSSN